MRIGIIGSGLIGSQVAKFATPGINIGLFCSTPMVALSRNVSRKHAMQMLLTGDLISADEAAGATLGTAPASGSPVAAAGSPVAAVNSTAGSSVTGEAGKGSGAGHAGGHSGNGH